MKIKDFSCQYSQINIKQNFFFFKEKNSGAAWDLNPDSLKKKEKDKEGTSEGFRQESDLVKEHFKRAS